MVGRRLFLDSKRKREARQGTGGVRSKGSSRESLGSKAKRDVTQSKKPANREGELRGNTLCISKKGTAVPQQGCAGRKKRGGKSRDKSVTIKTAAGYCLFRSGKEHRFLGKKGNLKPLYTKRKTKRQINGNKRTIASQECGKPLEPRKIPSTKSKRRP